MQNQIISSSQYSQLLNDISQLIENSKNRIEDFAKRQLILTYWQVGKRIDQEQLTDNAGYSASIFNQLSDDLKINRTTLNRCVQFFKTYPNEAPDNPNLNWSHYRYLLTINDSEIRAEIEKKASDESWSSTKMNEKLRILKESKSGVNSSQIERPNKANYLYRAQIVNVIDGDTLLLNIDLGFEVIKQQRVRLAAIDAAEIETSQGQKAFEFLRDLCAGINEVVIRTNKIDIYGRYIGDIFYSKINDSSQDKVSIFENGIYLNQKLFDEGMVDLI